MPDRAAMDGVIDEIVRSDSPRVKVAVVDIDGVLRGKYIHKDKFLHAARGGFGFCSVIFGWDSGDVCYDNTTFSGGHNGYPDAQARIDLATHRNIPWDDNIPFFLADFEDDAGKPLPVCPRQLLKTVIARAKDAGFVANCGIEFEWFNFEETPQSFVDKNHMNPTPISPGMFGYSITRQALNQPFFAALMEEMQDFRVPIEGLHTETGPGVLEAAILYSDALEAADRAVLFKSAAKEIGLRFGIMPSFMAKWNSNLPGCSGHLHQSLWDEKHEKNVFFDEKDPRRMSQTFKHYLAGQMALLPEILPFFAPNVNSYKRLVEGYWAPTSTTWGVDNRTVAFRVIPGSAHSTRLETRVPGSDINAYLTVAAALASGLYGIEHKLPLTDAPVTGSAYLENRGKKLARNLLEATELLQKSTIAREILGEQFVEHFAATRMWEWRQFQKSVTSFEMQRYFEII